MLATLAVPVVLASGVLAHGPARLDQPHLARRQVASSILSAYESAASGLPTSTASSSGTDSSSQQGQSYLPLIVAAADGTACTAEADQVTRVVAGCVATSGEDAATAVSCACSDMVLNITETAATCIVSDAANTNGTAPLEAYNAFVNQCISLSLTNSTNLASISGVSVSTATPTTTLVLPSSSYAEGFSTSGAPNASATDVAQATGSVSGAASSQVVTSVETSVVSPSASATGAGNGAVRTQAGAAVGALVVALGIFAVFA
ncbi:hypothetical protein JCM10207_008543 [Rhodosporidiobolus poonsookiae]